MARKKQEQSRKLTRVELPQTQQSNLILWKQCAKGFTVSGFITDSKKRKDRFGGISVIYTMKISDSTEKRYIGEEVAFFEPAALRNFLGMVNLEKYISITYQGKNEDGEHQFTVDAEEILFEE